MKTKFTFLCLALCFGTFSSFAQSINKDTRYKETKYYGTEASTNANNPCKGATTRVCAVVTTEASVLPDKNTLVTKTIKDADGNIISVINFIQQDIHLWNGSSDDDNTNGNSETNPDDNE